MYRSDKAVQVFPTMTGVKARKDKTGLIEASPRINLSGAIVKSYMTQKGGNKDLCFIHCAVTMLKAYHLRGAAEKYRGLATCKDSSPDTLSTVACDNISGSDRDFLHKAAITAVNTTVNQRLGQSYEVLSPFFDNIKSYHAEPDADTKAMVRAFATGKAMTYHARYVLYRATQCTDQAWFRPTLSI